MQNLFLIDGPVITGTSGQLLVDSKLLVLTDSVSAHLLHALQQLVAFSQLVKQLLAAAHLEYAWSCLGALHSLHSHSLSSVQSFGSRPTPRVHATKQQSLVQSFFQLQHADFI